MLNLTHPLMASLVQGYERHQHRLATSVTVLLALAAALSLAQFLWALVPVPESARWRAPPASTNLEPVNTAAALNTIINANLFGLYKAGTATDLSAVPDTRLDLKLIGILAGSRSSDSRAIISQQGSAEKSYAIGDDIVRGVSLQAIFADRVILSRNGQMETLRLDPNSGGAIAGSIPARIDSPSGTLPQQLSQVRQEMLQDPNKAADYIRIQPNNPGGQLHGYRIYPGKNAAVFTNAGLRPGDLVTSVNGIALDDTQKALQMLNDLSKASSVSLMVDRGGQLQTITVSFN